MILYFSDHNFRCREVLDVEQLEIVGVVFRFKKKNSSRFCKFRRLIGSGLKVFEDE